MKEKIWFKTNLGFLKTKDLLIKKHRDQISGDMTDSRGRLHFHLKGFKDVTFQITSKGKLGIYFPEGESYEDFLELVKPLLVKADGTPADKFDLIKEQIESKKVATLEKNVKKAIEDLRFRFFRDPTILEIAYRMGETPEAIRETAFMLAPKIGWKEPSEKQLSDADHKIKEIYETASLLEHFDANIVRKRPVLHLYGESYNRVLKRANYARKHEHNKLPKIVVTEEDNQRKEFRFEWPKGSQYYGNIPEYYDKENKTLSGQMKAFVETLKEFGDLVARKILKTL